MGHSEDEGHIDVARRLRLLHTLPPVLPPRNVDAGQNHTPGKSDTPSSC